MNMNTQSGHWRRIGDSEKWFIKPQNNGKNVSFYVKLIKTELQITSVYQL